MPPVPLKALNATHPEYDACALDEFEALYEGGSRWHKHVEKWIPKNAQEPDDLWRERKERAAYDNHCGPIIDLIVAWLFSKPPTVEGFDADWLKNVDRRGTALAPWIRNVVTDALKGRRAFVWVNLPALKPDQPAPTTRADEEAAGLHRPFLVDLTAAHVRDWGEDEHGNLAWVLLRQCIEERATIEGGRTKKYRWTWIDATRIRRWEYAPDPKGVEFPEDATATELDEIVHKLGRMPVARMDLPAGLHVMAKVRDPAVRLTRLANDLDWALHRGAHSLLVLSVGQNTTAPKLGAGYYLQVGAEDKVFYAEPGGAVYEALANRVDQAREELYRVVNQIAQGISGKSTKQANSAASKGLDWQSLQIMLAAYAEHVKALISHALQTAAIPMQIPEDKIVVGGLEGWQEDDLAQILEDYQTAFGVVKSPTFRKLQAKDVAKRMIPEGTDEKTRQTIFAEIEAADYADPPAWSAPIQPLRDALKRDDPEDDPEDGEDDERGEDAPERAEERAAG